MELKLSAIISLIQPAEDKFDDVVGRFVSFHQGFMRYDYHYDNFVDDDDDDYLVCNNGDDEDNNGEGDDEDGEDGSAEDGEDGIDCEMVMMMVIVRSIVMTL